MKEFLSELLLAIVTAAIPVITGYVVSYVRKAGQHAQANTDDIKKKAYAEEIAKAVSVAVSATSQTYVDSLKKAGKFTLEAQEEAARKALAACMAAISPAAQVFIQEAYGDLTEYLANKIEAEVWKQKGEEPAALSLPVLESTTDTLAVAASTAAATAANIAQTAIQQISAEPSVPEKPE